jgi:hypothetical protein
MFIGPIMLLIVVPALKIVFLGRGSDKSHPKAQTV